MSRRINDRQIVSDRNVDPDHLCKHRKCAHHTYSRNYATNIRYHNDIMDRNGSKINSVDMNSIINIRTIFHFLAPNGTYSPDRVFARANDIVSSINDDFNNYNKNPNMMNNFKYKNIVNQVFVSNMFKRNIYFGNEYMNMIPTKPSNITFELGEVYYYPVRNRLNLSQYNDVRDVELEYQAIKQYINQNRADALYPEFFLNIWIIDMVGTSILGFSNFPWEMIDSYNGVIINRRCFFPEDYGETNFSLFKTFTHEIGHYLGLLHVYGENNGLGSYPSANINADTGTIQNFVSTPNQLNVIYNPSDKLNNARLHSDDQYNPLFMNFMDYTPDKYVVFFTTRQIQKMRYMIFAYRPGLNTSNQIALPPPRYNPNSNTLGRNPVSLSLINRNLSVIPSREPVMNPRLAAQGINTSLMPITTTTMPITTNISSNTVTPFAGMTEYPYSSSMMIYPKTMISPTTAAKTMTLKPTIDNQSLMISPSTMVSPSVASQTMTMISPSKCGVSTTTYRTISGDPNTRTGDPNTRTGDPNTRFGGPNNCLSDYFSPAGYALNYQHDPSIAQICGRNLSMQHNIVNNLCNSNDQYQNPAEYAQPCFAPCPRKNYVQCELKDDELNSQCCRQDGSESVCECKKECKQECNCEHSLDHSELEHGTKQKINNCKGKIPGDTESNDGSYKELEENISNEVPESDSESFDNELNRDIEINQDLEPIDSPQEEPEFESRFRNEKHCCHTTIENKTEKSANSSHDDSDNRNITIEKSFSTRSKNSEKRILRNNNLSQTIRNQTIRKNNIVRSQGNIVHPKKRFVRSKPSNINF